MVFVDILIPFLAVLRSELRPRSIIHTLNANLSEKTHPDKTIKGLVGVWIANPHGSTRAFHFITIRNTGLTIW